MGRVSPLGVSLLIIDMRRKTMRKTLGYHQLKNDALVGSFSGAINW
jgi:hypothetical protein